MICPNCDEQMHQLKDFGGGMSTDKQYTTFEIKECGVCGRRTLEFYSAVLIEHDVEMKQLTKDILGVIEELELGLSLANA